MILILGHLVTKQCKKMLYCNILDDLPLSRHTVLSFIQTFTNSTSSSFPSDTPSSFFVLHWLTFFNALTAIVLLLLSRGHYSLDVIIAYFIATRAW